MVHLVTKHRSDTVAKLYRLNDPQEGRVNDLALVERFDFEGQATGADATADGRLVVVVTYTDLWLFEVEDSARPLSGPVRRLPLEGADQVEAVCFSGPEHDVLVADEVTGRLHVVPLAAFDAAP